MVQKQNKISDVTKNGPSIKSKSPSNKSPLAYPIPHPQQTINNQSLQPVSFGVLQTKLKISHPNDPYEEEAEHVADLVMQSTQTPILQRKCACAEGSRCPKCEEEEKLLKCKSKNAYSVGESVPDNFLQNIGAGQSLDTTTRTFMESRFGHDFSYVRIHTDQRAVKLTEAIGALAFTRGSDIIFGEGLYAPNTNEGRRLLAHELTHVVQQNKLNIGRYPRIWRQKARNAECTPAPGIPNTSCSAYVANSWWLPSAYVHNATCACKETPNSPTANCVRKFLQDRLAATPTWFKTMAAAAKLNPPAYLVFVQSVMTPRIYKDHKDAYAHCCCPCGPASYPAWIGVTTIPLPCDVVGWSIRQFGSCHCTPGAW